MITEAQKEEARHLIATGTPKAVGYRLMIKPLDAIIGLERAEKEKFQTLSKGGFETKSEDQRERESKGTHHGILISMGDYAYKTEALGGKPWLKEGDVVIFDRYAGVEIELPPGSGDKYRFTNDESILGVMEAKNV